MKLIYKNPYRILGVWAGAKDREIIRQKTKISAYLKVNKEINFDTDLKALPPLKRTSTLTDKSLSALEKIDQKILASLFWFTNFTPIDKTALNHLTSGNIQKAAEIWEKPAYQKTLSIRKISALNNLSTLKLTLGHNQPESAQKLLLNDFLKLKASILEEDALKHFIKEFGDDAIVSNGSLLEKTSKQFFKKIKTQYFNNGKLSISDLKQNLSAFPDELKENAVEVFLGDSIQNIESSVYKANQEWKDSRSTANKTGKHLYTRTFEDLQKVKQLLGPKDLTYKTLADKIATELTECGIAYYNHHTQDFEIDPGDDALWLLKRARQLAVGSTIIDRLDRNIPNIQEWVDNKPEREKLHAVKEERDFIYQKLNDAAAISKRRIYKSRELIQACKPKLSIIADKVGRNSSEYIRISSDIVTVAQGMIVQVVNNEQNKINNRYNIPPSYDEIKNLDSCFEQALDALRMLQPFAKTPELERQYNKNYDTIHSLKSTTGQQIRSEGCYIATMAYGSYHHPQVIHLRDFRDEVLAKSQAGLLFIRAYYFLSPKLIEILGHKPTLNKIIRKSLNLFINQIK